MATDLAQRQARAEFAVVGVAVAAADAVEPDVVDEKEHVAPGPAAGVLEGDGLLGVGVDLVVLAVEVGEAVVLPVQQVAGHGRGGEQAAGEGEAERGSLGMHGVVFLWCLS